MENAINILLESIHNLSCKKSPLLLAIDGRCASGKTTLALKIKEHINCNVIHMDHFFLRPEQRTEERLAQPGGNIDWERFLSEVLVPLSKDQTFLYRPYDCHKQEFREAIKIEPKPVALLEGSYSCHPRLFDKYDFHVFMNVDPAEQLRRIQARNGLSAAAIFRDKWIPLEEKYFASFNIAEKCELCLQTGTIKHFPDSLKA